MKSFKKANSVVQSTVQNIATEPAVTDVLDTFRNNIIEPIVIQQATLSAISEQATHYVNIVDAVVINAQPDIPIKDVAQIVDEIGLANSKPVPNPIDTSFNAPIDDVADVINDLKLPQASVDFSRVVNDRIKNPPDIKPVVPELIPIIENTLPELEATIELITPTFESPRQTDVNVSYPDSYSLVSNPINNVQTIEVINPKIIASMQGKATRFNSTTTPLGEQLTKYWEFSQLRNTTYRDFIKLIAARDSAINSFFTNIVSSRNSAVNELEKIDSTFKQFLEIEDTLINTFNIDQKPIPIGSSQFFNNLNVSITSKSKLTAFINQNCLPNFLLKSLLRTIGYETYVSNTQGLFVLLQSIKNSLIYHNSKLTTIQTTQITDQYFIPPPNTNPCQFGLQMPEDISFSTLNTILSLNEVGEIISNISSVYQGYIRNFPSDPATQIAVLLELSTKELRISSAINTKTAELSRRLNLPLTPGSTNLNILDTILGFIPLSTVATPTQPNSSTIAGFFQYKPTQDSTVLPFEVSPLRVDNQTFNTMTEFLYYAELKKFEQSQQYFLNILQFSLQFSEFFNNIKGSITKLRFLPYQDEVELKTNFENFYSVDLYQKITNSLSRWKSDPMGAILAEAVTDHNLRAALFLIFSFNFSGRTELFATGDASSTGFRSANLTHAFQVLRTKLSQLKIGSTAGLASATVSSALGMNQSSTRVQSSTLTFDQVIDSFNSSDEGLISSITLLLRSAMNTYTSEQCFVENKTSFVSVDQMTLMMSIFHAIVLYVKDNTTKFVDSVDKTSNTLRIKTKVKRQPTFGDATLSKLQDSTAGSFNELFYVLELFQKIKDDLFALNGRLNSGPFQQSITTIKNKLPSPTLISNTLLSQNIRNSRFYIKQIKDLFYSSLLSTWGSDYSDLIVVDEYRITKKQFDALFTFTGEIKNSSVVLAVGIPAGVQRKLQFQSKASNDPDVIKLKVYKIDQLNDTVVYKPLEFLFEMSRYVPTADVSTFETQTTTDPLKIVPTFDISTPNGQNQFVGDPMSNDRYKFLNNSQKQEILKNHVKSWYLMHYMRYLTGLNISENIFLMSPLTAPSMDQSTLERFFNSRPYSQIMNNNNIRATNKSSTARSDSPAYIREHYAVVNQLSRSTHIFSTLDHFIQKAITPTTFDRIFNIMFDDSEFQVLSGTPVTQETSKFITYYVEIESIG